MNTLFIVFGAPASGKTTFGAELAKARQAAFLDIDTSTERLVQAGLAASGMDINDRDSARFKELYRLPIYETLFDIAASNLEHTDVVITGPFTKEFGNANWTENLKRRFDCRVEIAACFVFCHPDKLLQRMKARNNPRDHGKLADWEEYRRYYDSQPLPEFPHQKFDTTELDSDDLQALIRARFL